MEERAGGDLELATYTNCSMGRYFALDPILDASTTSGPGPAACLPDGYPLWQPPPRRSPSARLSRGSDVCRQATVPEPDVASIARATAQRLHKKAEFPDRRLQRRSCHENKHTRIELTFSVSFVLCGLGKLHVPIGVTFLIRLCIRLQCNSAIKITEAFSGLCAPSVHGLSSVR